MPVRAGYLTVVHTVADIRKSIAFYKLLGFELIDVDHDDGTIVWARMHCEGGAIMFLPAEGAPQPSQGPVMYLYTEDLETLRAQLIAAGVDPGPVSRPAYMRSGEICLRDPDGAVLFVGHWGAAEHEAWEAQRARKREEELIP